MRRFGRFGRWELGGNWASLFRLLSPSTHFCFLVILATPTYARAGSYTRPAEVETGVVFIILDASRGLRVTARRQVKFPRWYYTAVWTAPSLCPYKMPYSTTSWSTTSKEDPLRSA